MARILEFREIPLADLVIGRGQVRTQSVGQELEDLVQSIKCQGLLQPIVVCRSEESGKWQILVGQRRFLAFNQLRADTIPAAVLDGPVSPHEAKAISITENLIRRKLSGKELKDGILFLYNQYGTIKDVAEMTGLPRKKISDNVKYPRLIPELKVLVNDSSVDINAALRAQDLTLDEEGNTDSEQAIKLARAIMPMSGAQRKRVADELRDRPDRPLDDIIEDASSGLKIIQIAVSVGQKTHRALQRFAREEYMNQDEAAASLIEEALIGRGLMAE